MKEVRFLMITFLYEWWVALNKGWTSDERTAFLVLITGLWILWTYVFVSILFYRPWRGSYRGQVTVIVPVFHEDWQTFKRAMNAILSSSYRLSEILIVGDDRDTDFVGICRDTWDSNPLVRVLQAAPGKRAAIRKGIEQARTEIIVVIESDTFAAPNGIEELIKPFMDARVGGVVGKQLIYEPNSLTAVLNNWAEAIKYAFMIPFQSQTGCVTVLGGRCVAYRRSAVLPLMEGLTSERFLGFKCQAGDDGRLTSLLLATGWRTVYQSSADFRTVSPETYWGLLQQRLRWFRNSCRRTLRAMFCIRESTVRGADRFWVYKKPRALYQMLRTWLSSVIMIILWYLLIKSLYMGYYWHWFGALTVWDILGRLLIISVLGGVLTKLIKAYPILQTRPGWWILALPLFPFHMSIAMVLMRLFAIPTMVFSGWISRKATGKGGFGN